MIEMSMCAKQMNGCEFFFVDVSGNSIVFISIYCSAVDDDTLTCLIAHHETVFLDGVDYEFLDIQHLL